MLFDCIPDITQFKIQLPVLDKNDYLLKMTICINFKYHFLRAWQNGYA